MKKLMISRRMIFFNLKTVFILTLHPEIVNLINVIKLRTIMIKAAYKTKQQELLLSYLRETKGIHFTAEDIRRHFAEKNITLGVATIYRQLEKLVSEGQVQKYFIDEHSASCFEYTGESSADGTEPHFHLKCEKCGELFHVECEEITEIISHLQNEHGFLLNPFRTVLYGICKSCGKKDLEGKKMNSEEEVSGKKTTHSS